MLGIRAHAASALRCQPTAACAAGHAFSLLLLGSSSGASHMSFEVSRSLAVAVLQRGVPALCAQLRALLQQLALVLRAWRAAAPAAAQRLAPLARQALAAAAALVRLLARSRAYAQLQAALLRCVVVAQASRGSGSGPAAARRTVALGFTLPLVGQR